MNTIKRKLRSIQLCLSAHPDNEPSSELADRISDIKEIQQELDKENEKSRIEGILLGLNICKEMWAQGTISHENIYEHVVYYEKELQKLSDDE